MRKILFSHSLSFSNVKFLSTYSLKNSTYSADVSVWEQQRSSVIVREHLMGDLHGFPGFKQGKSFTPEGKKYFPSFLAPVKQRLFK